MLRKMKEVTGLAHLDFAVRFFIRDDYSSSFYFENIGEAVCFHMSHLANEQEL